MYRQGIKSTHYSFIFLDDNLEEEFISYYTCTYKGLEFLLIFEDNDEFIDFSKRLKKDPLIDVEYQFNTAKKENAG